MNFFFPSFQLVNLGYTIDMRRIIFILLTLLILGCDQSGHSDKSTIGKRIVSLSPNYTELVYALGAQDQLVGRTGACDYPPEVESIPVVGSYANPNWEKLIAAGPNLVLTADFQDQRMPDLLHKKGIDVYCNDVHSIVQLLEMIQEVADKIDKSEAGRLLVEKMNSELAAITADAEQRSHKPRVLVVVWPNPMCVVGGHTFIADAIKKAGGINVTDEIAESYVNISPEKLIQWQPEIILFPQMKTGISADLLLNYPGLENVPAIKNKRIITEVSGDEIFRPGPRLVNGVGKLSQQLKLLEDDKSVQ